MIGNISKDNTVFICYGSPKHMLDSYAPRLGTKLKEYGFEVYGTMENPIDGNNVLKESVRLSNEFKYKHIVAIDSCLGDEVGTIKFRDGKGVVPASYRFLTIVIGDDSIIGITTDNICKITKHDENGKEMIESMVNETFNEIIKISKNSEK